MHTSQKQRQNIGLQKSTDRGFTLLELLVVIAIIALLIAILLPSLESARRQSKQAACLAHMKGIGTSSRVYEADDPAGWGIPVHPLQFHQDPINPTFIGAYEWGGKSGIGSIGFVPGGGTGKYAALTSKYGTKAGFGPASRPMNDILYPGGFTDNLVPRFERDGALRDTELNLDLFKCPADDGPPRGAHCSEWVENSEMSSYDYFGNSYAANIFMVSLSGVANSPVWSNSPYMRPVSRIPTPARTLYYEENIGRWAWNCKKANPDCFKVIPGLAIDPGPTKVVRGWHGKNWTFNRTFVDSHAETQAVIIQGTEDPEGFSEHYRVELAFPDSPALQRRNTCVIIRGDGWQKDTLPAELILTHLVAFPSGRMSFEGCVQPTG